MSMRTLRFKATCRATTASRVLTDSMAGGTMTQNCPRGGYTLSAAGRAGGL
jgi:hypothetical protein